MKQPENVQDIFKACTVIPEGQRFPDTVLSLSYGLLKEEEEIQENSLSMCGMFKNIRFGFVKTGNFIQAELDFENHNDPKIRRILDTLNIYEKDNKDHWKDDIYPELQISVLPLSYEGQFQIILSNPITFSFCSDAPVCYPHKIRMLFDAEEVVIGLHQNVNFKKLMAEIKRRTDLEEFYAMEEEKKLRQVEYEAEFGLNKADKGGLS